MSKRRQHKSRKRKRKRRGSQNIRRKKSLLRIQPREQILHTATSRQNRLSQSYLGNNSKHSQALWQCTCVEIDSRSWRGTGEDHGMEDCYVQRVLRNVNSRIIGLQVQVLYPECGTMACIHVGEAQGNSIIPHEGNNSYILQTHSDVMKPHQG